MLQPEYLYINDEFRVLARFANTRYGNSQVHGRTIAGAASLQKALCVAESLVKDQPKRFTFGIRVSEEAVAKAAAMEKTDQAQKAAREAVTAAVIEEYAEMYGYGY